MQGGLINLSAQISVEDGNPVWILVTGGFGTTPYAFDPLGINIGGANLQVKTYLDSILQPESFSSSNYSQFALALYITAPPDPCADQACQVNYIKPDITLQSEPFFYNMYTTNYLRYNPCELNPRAQGFFMLADQELAEIDVQDACYDLQSKKWKFNINSPINLISIWGLCERPTEYTFINSIDEVPDWYLCPPPENPPAPRKPSPFIEDLTFRFYFNVNGLKFYPTELVREEEMIHFSQINEKLNLPEWQKKFQEFLDAELNYSCEDFTNLDSVRTTVYEKVVKPFRYKFWAEILSNRRNIEEEMKKQLKPFITSWIDLANEAIKIRCN